MADSSQLRIGVMGGGAAGFFAAIAAAEAAPTASVILFEGTAHPLAKVRISGGGRCNVTHACFEPRELVKRYPRGHRELLGPFHRFGPRDTIAWFAARGVELKTEADGRMFPVTDDSATIVECLQRSARDAGVHVSIQSPIRAVEPTADGRFELELREGRREVCDRIVVATGGNRGSTGLSIAERFGHALESPVPSLFTFNIADERLRGLEGVSVNPAEVSVLGTALRERGPVLVTHWGLSGPAILRLSAWGARDLAAVDYRFPLQVNWAGVGNVEHAFRDLVALRTSAGRKQLASLSPWALPARLWQRLLSSAACAPDQVWGQATNGALQSLATAVTETRFAVAGKSTNKDEFVTCGGVRLREIDFKTMQSRLCPGLFFAGEVLDIDGITGGFNFQAAWTTGWLAGRGAAGVT